MGNQHGDHVTRERESDAADGKLEIPSNLEVADYTHVYRMDHKRRGFFLIINNKIFDPRTKMGERSGTDKDASNLYEAFKVLGFDVKLVHNRTCEQMLKDLKDAATTYDHKNSDCFGCAILSHGDTGIIYGTNGIVTLDDIVAPFKGDKCTALAGKPKIFIFQACRGSQLDKGTIVSDSGLDGQKPQVIPIEADILYCYSTTPGYFSWRNSTNGSWFIQSLKKVFDRFGFDHEMLWLMTRVSHAVAYEFESNASQEHMNKKKQVPSVVSMLTKELYFKPKG